MSSLENYIAKKNHSNFSVYLDRAQSQVNDVMIVAEKQQCMYIAVTVSEACLFVESTCRLLS